MTDRVSGRSRNVGKLGDALPWDNVSGETIPAYGVVQFRSNYSTAIGYSQAKKPDGATGLFYTNGPVPVAANKKGSSRLWSRPQAVLIDGTLLVGDEVGPTEGSWMMSADGSGFRVLLQTSSGIGVVERVGGGGGGTHRIRFTIDEVDCEDPSGICVYVNHIAYSAGCTDPPGMESDGRIKVYDTCILSYLTADQLLTREGSATYWYETDDYGVCTPKWRVDDLCDAIQCSVDVEA